MVSDPLTGRVTMPKEALAHDFLNRQPANYKSAFADLWAWANDRPRTITVGAGRPIKLLRGQLAYAQTTLAKLWRWSVEKVKAFLVELQNEGLITFDATFTTTIITVLDYTIYNPDSTPETAANSAAKPIANSAQKLEVGSTEGGSGEAPRPEIPCDEVIRKFCSEWPGDMARGIPSGIPEVWWSGWVANRLNDEKKWPRDWQRALVLAFRADFLNRHPKALVQTAVAHHGNGSTLSANVVAIQSQVRTKELAEKIREIEDELHRDRLGNLPRQPGKSAELKKLRGELAAMESEK